MFVHIAGMAGPTNKDKLLAAGLELIHERGFGAVSVRDIVRAANVPQGSFTNHFTTKESFGLAILEIYFSANTDMILETLRNDAAPPLDRLRAYIAANKRPLEISDMRTGCLYGNFCAEAGEVADSIRHRLAEILTEITASIKYCLDAAIAEGSILGSPNSEALANFILSSLEGAILLSRAKRSLAPFDNFVRMLFEEVLHVSKAS